MEVASPLPATVLNCCRRLTKLVASTVVESVTAAAVCALCTIRSAIVRRMGLTGISWESTEEATALPMLESRAGADCALGDSADVALHDPAVLATSAQSDCIHTELTRHPPGTRGNARLYLGTAKL